jgi:hypothetical protein
VRECQSSTGDSTALHCFPSPHLEWRLVRSPNYMIQIPSIDACLFTHHYDYLYMVAFWHKVFSSALCCEESLPSSNHQKDRAWLDADTTGLSICQIELLHPAH